MSRTFTVAVLLAVCVGVAPSIAASPSCLERYIEMLQGDSAAPRGNACLGLQELGPEAAPAAPHLVALIDDYRPLRFLKGGSTTTRVDIEAIRALEAIGRPAVPALIDGLSGSFHTATVCARHLGRIGDDRAVVPLIAVLETHRFNRPRAGGLSQVLWPGEETRVQAWLSLIDSAAQALTEIGDKRAVEPLIDLLSDRDLACGLRGTFLQMWMLDDPRVTELLISALDDNCLYKRAAQGLGRLGDPSAVGPLMAKLEEGLVRREGGDLPPALVPLLEVGCGS